MVESYQATLKYLSGITTPQGKEVLRYWEEFGAAVPLPASTGPRGCSYLDPLPPASACGTDTRHMVEWHS